MKISSVAFVLAVSGALVGLASCAEADPAVQVPQTDGSTIPDVPSDDGGADAACEAGSDGCPSADVDCSKVDFCPVPTGADSRIAFTSVWGSSKDDVWMVGTRGTIVHFDGSSFTATPSGTKNALFAVSGTGPTDVWAVGSRETVLHSTGFANGAATWTLGPAVAPQRVLYGTPANENLLLALSMRAGGEVWTAGEPYPVVPEGGTQAVDVSFWRRRGWSDDPWTTDVIGSGLVVRGFWSSGTDVWAVGGNDTKTVNRRGRTFHSTGDELVWTEYDSQSFNELNAVWGSGVNDVWTVGNNGAVRRWTGESPKRWQLVDVPTEHDLSAIWGSGPNDIWVVGDSGTILHFDGTSWTQPVAAFPAGLKPHLRGVWGSGPNDVWVVGDSMVLHFTGKVARP